MTKTDWTAETTDRLRTIVEFVNGRCTNEEAGRKCLGFIMQYGESWLERIEADGSAVPVAAATNMPGTTGFTMAVFEASKVPPGTDVFTHPPAQPAQETPCSLNEALNVFENWGRRGNTLNGYDVDRFRALADKIAPAQEQPGWKVPEGWARTEAKLHERKTVHEWLNDLHIEREEFGKSLCLLRRLRILCDRYADTCAQLSFEILKQAGWISIAISQPERNATAIYWHMSEHGGFPDIADEWRDEHHLAKASHWMEYASPTPPKADGSES